MKVTVPFTNWNQKSEVDGTLPSVIDLTNKSLFACVRLDSDLDSDGGLMPSNSTACYAVALAVSDSGSNTSISYGANICPGAIDQWVQFTTLQFATETSLDPLGNVITIFDSQHVSAVDLTFQSAIRGPTGSLPPGQAIFHVDTIGYR